MTDEQYAKKALGQHWLKDQASLEAICSAAGVQTDDVVLEIGPGTGELTRILIQSGAQIIAIEYDESLISSLQQQFSGTDIKIEQGDIRTYNLTKLPQNYKIVANIPYYLTAYLLRLLTETSNKPATAALLVQKEVAERIASEPGKMSFISVAAHLYYDVTLGVVVPAKLFTPAPKIDSQVLILNRLDQPRFTEIDDKQFLKLVKAGFNQPRKTLVNNLSNGLQKDRSVIEDWLNNLNLNLTIRAQELSLQSWHSLYTLQKAS